MHDRPFFLPCLHLASVLTLGPKASNSSSHLGVPVRPDGIYSNMDAVKKHSDKKRCVLINKERPYLFTTKGEAT
jgi:hypothetical protein